MLPTYSYQGICEELKLMQGGIPHSLRFMFLHDLTTVSFLGGLGVEDEKNCC
jgi:hypothetical protein